ncbi:hypothetical protein KY385_02750 [Candidatus Parcubacteria bacterium]|nr:hypothetical protein [Candidatus Parcubacteria bacterium]
MYNQKGSSFAEARNIAHTLLGSISKKTFFVTFNLAAATILAAAAIASSGKSESTTAAEGSASSRQTELKEKIDMDIDSSKQPTLSKISSKIKQPSSSNAETEVNINGQSVPIKKNGVTQKTIRSADGETFLRVESYSSSNGSSTNLSMNSSTSNSNSSGSANSYSHSSVSSSW